MATTDKTIWLSYDLGLKGDYPNLYKWLDSKGAKECGDSLAVFKIKKNGDVVSSLIKDLKKSLTLKETDRVYIIYLDDKTGLIKGKFISGSRERAPWEGYAYKGSQEEDV